MIKVIAGGRYIVFETRHKVKILSLDDKVYVWLSVPGIGDVLEKSAHEHKAEQILSIGNYRLYEVRHEKRFSAHTHLELCVGTGRWQSYLLLSGLPDSRHRRVRIIASSEVISSSKVSADC